MKMILKSFRDVLNIPIGYSWESGRHLAGILRMILFALITGDRNKIHINPFTFIFYKSNLGGLTYPGDLVLALTKEGIHQIFDFEDDVEVIAFGYELVEFKRPLRVGSLYRYRYTLLGREIVKGAVRCRWRVEVVDNKGKILAVAVWANGYYPVARAVICEKLASAGQYACQGFAVATLLVLLIGQYFYVPMNEYSYPLAP